MNYKHASDITLWQSCCENDMRAYNELFTRYYPRAFSLASRYIQDAMKAEELCMDQFFTLWTKRHTITIHTDFSGYLFRSVRNLVISHLRKNVQTTTQLDDLIGEHQLDRPADYQLMSDEAEQAYRNALEALSPQRRQVYILSREENLSYSEIAQRMDLSVNTVENYMVAALSSLRKNIHKYVTPVLIIILSL